MKKAFYGVAFLVAVLATIPSSAYAQWGSSAPNITVTADVAAIRQFQTGTSVNLNFGSNGITPGVAHEVSPTASNPATGTSAKVNIRFNAGTRVTVNGSSLYLNGDQSGQAIVPSYQCAAAEDQSGTGIVNFSSCDAGHEWSNVSVSNLIQRSVLIGATIPATETETKAAGTYTGTITISLAASNS